MDVVDLRLLDLDGAALVLSLPREGELAAHVLARDLGLHHRAAEDLDAIRQRAVRQQRQDVHDVEPRELRVEDLALLAVGARDRDVRAEAVCLGRELQHGVVREVERALDGLRRDFASLRLDRDLAVLDLDHAEERALARTLRLDVLDIPSAVLTLDEAGLDM